MRRLLLALLLGVGVAAVSVRPLDARDRDPPVSPTITVFAATSLSDALDAAALEFTRRTGIRVRHAYAATSQLARQIEAGARAEVFVAADEQWLTPLAEKSLIDARSLRSLAGNRLVVIQPSREKALTNFDPSDLTQWQRALRGSRLVTGDPDYVPLGRYAREALRSLGVWSALSPTLARAENARIATALVARGEAPLGIVYATDAIDARDVRVVHRLDPALHTPIRYSAVLTREADESARRYLEFLASREGEKFFADRGFERLR